MKKGLPGRGEISVQYNAQNLPIAATLPNKAIWQYQYDEAGNLLTSTNPLSSAVQYGYDNGLLRSIAGNNGAVTELFYDRQYNLAQVSLSGERGAIRYQYDSLGNCTKIIDPARNEQTRRYDLKNRLTYLLEEDGNVRRFSYNANDDVVQASDNYTQIGMAYDFLGNLTRRMQGGTEIQFGYDTEGQLRFLLNEHKEDYRFEYDGDGNVIIEIGFDGITRRYLRNLCGQTVQVERPGGKSTRYQYNSDGQVTDVLYTDGSRESYGYDAMGALTQASNDTAQVSLQRDLLGRVLQETQGQETVSSTYNPFGLRERITSSLGADIQTSFSEETGFATSLTAGAFKAEMKYNRDGLVTAKELNGGVTQQFEYDKLGRLTGQQIVQQKRNLHNRNYVWEAGYRLKKITDSEYGQKQFQHNVYGNLSEVIYGNGETDFRMPDAVGNLFETRQRTDRTYCKGGKLLTNKGNTYEYDTEGNLIRKIEKGNKVWQYHWNEAGMLQSVVRPDGATVSFGYDALGRRV